MKRDKRKGALAGYRKASPLVRFSANLAIVGFFLTLFIFIYGEVIDTTKTDSKAAQHDRDEKHNETSTHIDEVQFKIDSALEQISTVVNNGDSSNPKSRPTNEPPTPPLPISVDSPKFFNVTLTVNYKRKDAKIYVDGKFYGEVGDTLKIAKGSHELKLEHTNPVKKQNWQYIDSIRVLENKSILIGSNGWTKK